MRTTSSGWSRLVLCATLAILSGCATLVEYLPSPSESRHRIDLTGPYDRDIPEPFLRQLQDGKTPGGIIPYLFLNIAEHFEGAGDDLRALHFLERSGTEYRRLKSPGGEGLVMTRQVSTLMAFGRDREARDLIRERQQAWTEIPKPTFVQYSAGYCTLLQGDLAKALEHFRLAGSVGAGPTDDFNLLLLRRDAVSAQGLAMILGPYRSRLSKSSGLARPVEDDGDKGRIREGIGLLEQALILNGDIRRAVIGPFTPERSLQTLEANIHHFLGLAQGLLKDWEGAHRHLAAARDLSRQAGIPAGGVDDLFFLNQIHLLQRDVTRSRREAEELREQADRYHYPFYQIWARFVLSRYQLDAGEIRKAIAHLRQATAIIEEQQPGLSIERLQEAYLFDRQFVYEALVDLLARTGDAQGALEAAEKAKSRLFIDLLAREDITRSKEEAALLGLASRAAQDVLRLRKRIGATRDEKASDALRQQLKAAETAHRAALTGIKAQNEEFASLVSPVSLDIPRIQSLLDPNTTLFDYFVTYRSVYVWAVSREQIHLERIRMGREELRSHILSFWQALSSPSGKQVAALSQRFYDLLLKPVIPFVSGDRIGFIPHDALHGFPFSAMSYKGRYLIDGFALFNLPHAGALPYVLGRKKAPIEKVLVFADPVLGEAEPSLPFATEEAEEIRKRFAHTITLTGKDATRQRALDLMDGFDLVHFAVPRDDGQGDPLQAALLLTPTALDNGRLTAQDIFRCRFGGQAVAYSAGPAVHGATFSACGLAVFNRAFLYAGAPAVLSSLWTVNDRARSDLTNHFYRHLTAGKGYAEALQAAQTEMLRRGHGPSIWGGFVLTGRD